jgi:hypothetical protein
LTPAKELRAAGLRVVITVRSFFRSRTVMHFFERIANAADGVVIDHFIQGDAMPNGARTRKTALPAAMQRVLPASIEMAYRDRIIEIARQVMPAPVGVRLDRFAGRFLEEHS